MRVGGWDGGPLEAHCLTNAACDCVCILHSNKSAVCHPRKHIDMASIHDALALECIDPTLFRSIHLWTPPSARGVFGGQVVGQAMVAASNTLPSHFHAHSLHAYFLLAGDASCPILYKVDALRDGTSYATRRVTATQYGKPIFSCTCSFSVREPSVVSYQLPMPKVPDPEELPSTTNLMLDWSRNETLPETWRNELKRRALEPFPIDTRLVETPKLRDFIKPNIVIPARRLVWIRALGDFASKDMPASALHQCILAYASDHQLLWSAMLPHGITPLSSPLRLAMMTSLDHTVWFHQQEIRTDEWLLYEIESDWSGNGRGFARGKIYTKEGMLVASVAQEGVMRVSTVKL